MEKLRSRLIALFGDPTMVSYCLGKSTIFINRVNCIIVGNTEYIYYIYFKGTKSEKLALLGKYYSKLSGKIAYTKIKAIVQFFSSEILSVSKDSIIEFRIR